MKRLLRAQRKAGAAQLCGTGLAVLESAGERWGNQSWRIQDIIERSFLPVSVIGCAASVSTCFL
jgi:hypothetical protein